MFDVGVGVVISSARDDPNDVTVVISVSAEQTAPPGGSAPGEN